MLRVMLATLVLVLGLSTAESAPLPESLPGWVMKPTDHSYQTLVSRIEAAVGRSPLNKVTQASATVGAKGLGKTIPGNMVIGVFAPTFAIRMLEASIAAGIEAPIRLYITENDDKTATLSYETASHVFAPYADGGSELRALAVELDTILATIAADAAGN